MTKKKQINISKRDIIFGVLIATNLVATVTFGYITYYHSRDIFRINKETTDMRILIESQLKSEYNSSDENTTSTEIEENGYLCKIDPSRYADECDRAKNLLNDLSE